MRLRVVDATLDVADELVGRAREKANVEPFSAGHRSPELCLRLDDTIETGEPLLLDGAQLGVVRMAGDAFTFRLTNHPLAAVAALRLGWFALAQRQSGVMVHSSAIRFPDGGAVLAAGPSGAGKSTLARLCCEAASAALLSDEINVLLPQGRVCGSPFMSDYQRPGSPDTVPLRMVVRLSKEDRERLHLAPPTELARLLFAQTFRTALLPVTAATTLAQLSEALEGVATAELGFRNVPAAAVFLAAQVSSRQP